MPERRAAILAAVAIVVAAIAGLFANVAAEDLRELVGSRHAWWILALLTGVAAWIAVRQLLSDSHAHSHQRTRFLSNVQQGVTKVLSNHRRDERLWSALTLKAAPDLAATSGLPVERKPFVAAGSSSRDILVAHGPRLLLLGDKGAGKTVWLLELTSTLLDAALADEHARMPAFINLSSWRSHHASLQAWAGGELGLLYGAGKNAVDRWFTAGELLLVLDGLDEVKEEHRRSCIEAINSYIAAAADRQLIVSCRESSYRELASTLDMNGAVVLQPLTTAQVRGALTRAGLAGLATVWDEDASLRESLANPLFLDVAAQSFSNLTADDIRAGLSGGTLRERLWEHYVDRAFTRKRNLLTVVRERAEVERYLRLWARTLQAQGLSELRFERLKAEWFRGDVQRTYSLVVATASGLVAFVEFAAFLLAMGIGTGAGVGITIAAVPVAVVQAISDWRGRSGRRIGKTWRVQLAVLVGAAQAVLLIILTARVLGLPLATLISGATGVGVAALLLRFGEGASLRLDSGTVLRWSWRQWAESVKAYAVVMLLAVAVALVLRYVGRREFPVEALILGALALTPITTADEGWVSDAVQSSRSGRLGAAVRRCLFFSGRVALISAIVSGAIALLLWPVARGWGVKPGAYFLICSGVTFYYAMLAAESQGLDAVRDHAALRWSLVRHKAAPRHFVAFLQEACALGLMREKNGVFEFWHLDLRDFLSRRTGEEAGSG